LAIAAASAEAGSIDCVNEGIAIIAVQVLNSAGDPIAQKEFTCESHEGTVTGIPAGSGYQLVVSGKPEASEPDVYRGGVSGVSVSPSVISQLGVVKIDRQFTELKLTLAKTSLQIGETTRVAALQTNQSVAGFNLADVEFVSSDPSVVVVEAGGNLFALGAGDAAITARFAGLTSASVPVKVGGVAADAPPFVLTTAATRLAIVAGGAGKTFNLAAWQLTDAPLVTLTPECLSDVRCEISAATITPARPGANFSLTVTAPENTTPGIHLIQLLGEGGGHTANLTVAVHVYPPAGPLPSQQPDYDMSASPRIRKVRAGEAAEYKLLVVIRSGSPGTINFDFPNCPSEVSCFFNGSSNVVASGGATPLTFKIKTFLDTPPGRSEIMVETITNRGIKTIPVLLDVLPRDVGPTRPAIESLTGPNELDVEYQDKDGAGTVTLDKPAFLDTTVTLVSSDKSVLTVPDTITVPADDSSVRFIVRPIGPGTATITAKVGNSPDTSTLDIKVTPVRGAQTPVVPGPPPDVPARSPFDAIPVVPAPAPVLSTLTCPSELQVGQTGRPTCTVTLDKAALVDTTVTLDSDNKAVLAVPATIMVPANRTTTSGLVTILSSGTAIVSATLGSETQRKGIRVLGQRVTLTVNKLGGDGGIVTSDPPGISCAGTTCTASFPVGQTVTLRSSLISPFAFTGWSGGGCSGTALCVVVLGSDTTVNAQYTTTSAPPGSVIDIRRPPVIGIRLPIEFIRTVTLTVERSGTGSGTVASAQGEISCDPTCQNTFLDGSSVTLAATAFKGSSFTGWSGGGCSGTGSCTVSLTGNTSVTATFNTLPIRQSTVSSDPFFVAPRPTSSTPLIKTLTIR
jgi:hypothetical protein